VEVIGRSSAGYGPRNNAATPVRGGRTSTTGADAAPPVWLGMGKGGGMKEEELVGAQEKRAHTHARSLSLSSSDRLAVQSSSRHITHMSHDRLSL
jgi:hypothetical protein